MVQVVGGLPRSQRKLGTQNGLEVIVVSDAEKKGGLSVYLLGSYTTDILFGCPDEKSEGRNWSGMVSCLCYSTPTKSPNFLWELICAVSRYLHITRFGQWSMCNKSVPISSRWGEKKRLLNSKELNRKIFWCRINVYAL